MSNVWEKSTFQTRQNYPAPVGLLPEPDLESAGFRPEPELAIRYSPSLMQTSWLWHVTLP